MAKANNRTDEDFFALFKRLRTRSSSRKRRLFACACCRRVWPMIDERSRRLVEAAERFADGLVGRKEVVAARAASPGRAASQRAEFAVKAALHASADDSVYAATGASICCVEAAVRVGSAREEELAQTDLLRELLSRPPAIDPTWLEWNNGAAPRLAQAIYNDQRFDQMAILADALEEAGCDIPVILQHARRTDGHVRGCWLIDALLGKG